MGMRIPYSFLVDIANRFRTTFGERVNTAASLSFNDTFSRVLQERLVNFQNRIFLINLEFLFQRQKRRQNLKSER